MGRQREPRRGRTWACARDAAISSGAGTAACPVQLRGCNGRNDRQLGGLAHGSLPPSADARSWRLRRCAVVAVVDATAVDITLLARAQAKGPDNLGDRFTRQSCAPSMAAVAVPQSQEKHKQWRGVSERCLATADACARTGLVNQRVSLGAWFRITASQGHFGLSVANAKLDLHKMIFSTVHLLLIKTIGAT